jgi:hypothetical protein
VPGAAARAHAFQGQASSNCRFATPIRNDEKRNQGEAIKATASSFMPELLIGKF